MQNTAGLKRFTFLLLLSTLYVSTGNSQSYLESGYPLITNYSPNEYSAMPGNWAIAQDNRGVMYFGNDAGLLEYDGASWRLYPVPNKTTIRSIAIAEDDKIYTGAVGDLGYFTPDSSGRLIFHSLFNYLPKDKRDFSDVWQTFNNEGKVYFNTMKYIFVWDIQKKKFNVLQGKDNFHLDFLVNGKIYAREWGKGLEELKDNKLILLKGGEKFANERIYIMLPFPGEPGTDLIVTRTMGLFKYNGENFIPFKTEVDKFLKDNLVYLPGTVLSDGNILIGTNSGGAVVIDTTGKEIKRYNKENGTSDNSIIYTFQDQYGAIWLGSTNGISRIDYSSPISYFDSRNNLSSAPIDIIRHKGIIYVAANNGIYSLDPQSSNFNRLGNYGNETFSLLEIGDELLAGIFDGLVRVEKDKLTFIRRTIGNEYIVQSLKQSRLNPKRIYIGAQGLWSVLKTSNGWKDEGRILNITDYITSMVQDQDGTLWVGTNASGVFKIKFRRDENANEILTKPDIIHFDKTNGLPSGYLKINKINDVNYFSTPDSIYKFNESKNKFYSDTSDYIIASFYKIIKNSSAVLFQEDNLGRLWIGTINTLAMGTHQPDGSYQWLTSPFNMIAREQVIKVYTEKNDITWFCTGSGLIRYDFSKKNSNNINYAALIRNVAVGKDSTIYFGGMITKPDIPEIAFRDNSIKFNFAAVSYEGKNTNRFKTFLKGFDDDWSSWSNENTKEYTNLPPGKYTFNVMAENILGKESTPGTYSFEILPPWYRTWWAYIFYVLFLVSGIFTIDRKQRRRLVKKERERAEYREAKLLAESENERRKNVELLSEIGKEITASLDLDKIFYKLYEHVNQLADASIFGVGIYHPDKGQIEYKLAIEEGKRYPVYTRDAKDKNQLPVWCIENKKPVFINDAGTEYSKYIPFYKEPVQKFEDGTKSKKAYSIIYLPLISKDRLLGVITIQSFQKNAYTDYHLSILETLASYTAIALDNADAYRKLNSTISDLKTTQEKLVTQEKLASLGALTAGIAHEIKNPLNFVNNFSDISRELLDDIRTELTNKNEKEVAELIEDLNQNLEKINQHGKRADSIVKGMLLHSRGTAGEKILTDVNELLDQYVALAYHGLRAQNKEFNITIEKDYDNSLEKVNIVPQDISRVFLNIINNACYAAYDKKKKSSENNFSPTLKVSTKNLNGKFEVRIKDNGNGVPASVKEQIFNPFFTTKPVGEGTGLGLSLSYEIVTKMHGGELKFESEEGKYTEFVIVIPK